MDQDDLNQIVDGLSRVLAPHIREIVNELVAVRIESSMQAVHLRVDESVSTAQSATQQVTQRITDAFDSIQAVRTELQKGVEDATARLENQVSQVHTEIQQVAREGRDVAETGRIEVDRHVQTERAAIEQATQAQQTELKEEIGRLTAVVTDVVKDIVGKMIVLRSDDPDADGDEDPLDSVWQCLNEMQETVKKHDTAIESTTAAQAGYGKTLDAHTERMDSMDTAVSAMGTNITALAQDKVGKVDLDKKAEPILSAIEDHGHKIGSMHDTQDDHGKRIKSMETEFEALQSAVDGKADKKSIDDVGVSLTALSGTSVEHATLLASHVGSIDVITSNVAEQEERIAPIAVAVEALQSVVDGKADKKSVDDLTVSISDLSGVNVEHGTLLTSHSLAIDANAASLAEQAERTAPIAVAVEALTAVTNVLSDALTLVDKTQADHGDTLHRHGVLLTQHAAGFVEHSEALTQEVERVAPIEIAVTDLHETVGQLRQAIGALTTGQADHTEVLDLHNKTLEQHNSGIAEHIAALEAHVEQAAPLAIAVDALRTAIDEKIDKTTFVELDGRLKGYSETLHGFEVSLNAQSDFLEKQVGYTEPLAGTLAAVVETVSGLPAVLLEQLRAPLVEEALKSVALTFTAVGERVDTRCAETISAVEASIGPLVEQAVKTQEPAIHKMVTDKIDEVVPVAVAAANQPVHEQLQLDLEQRLEEHKKSTDESAIQAGMLAAGRVVPDLVDARMNDVQETMTNRATEVAKATAVHDTATALSEFEPLMSAKVQELASQVSMRTATALVPDLVDGRADELTARVAQRATEQASEAATRAAVQAGEAAGRATMGEMLTVAEARAREVSEPIAHAAATVAAKALRDELVIALDPTELINKTVKESVDALSAKLSTEFGDAIGDATEKHIGEEIPRLKLELTARIQSEIDRIPIPKDGKNGEDARITPAVPWEKDVQYPFGTWVSHKNGVWAAARSWTMSEPSTDNRDWDCLVAGLKTIAITQEGDRVLRFVVELSDGTTETSEAVLNIPIIRGVYAENFAYDENDVVTSNGSWWAAKKTGVLSRPGVNADEWQLHIKHGRDGKAAEMPIRGERYKGEWKAATVYLEGDIVQHIGFRWLAMRSTREQPFQSDDSWSRLGEGT